MNGRVFLWSVAALLLVPAAQAYPSGPPTLRGAFPQKFLPDTAVHLFLANFELFGNYVASKSGIRIRLEARPDVASIEKGIREGKLDFCFGISDLEALHLEDSLSLVPFLTVSPFRDLAQNGFRHLVVTRKEEGARGLRELKGWTLRHVEDYGETFKGIPAIMAEILIREGTPATPYDEATPSRTVPSQIAVFEYGQSRNLILDVMTTPKTAAVIDEEAYLLMKRRNPKIESALQILFSGEPVPIAPLLLRPGLDAGLLARVKKVLLEMHRDPEGDEIMKTLRVGKWVDVRTEDYAELRKIVQKALGMGVSLIRGGP